MRKLRLKPAQFLYLIALVLIMVISTVMWFSENTVATVSEAVGSQTVLPFYATRTVQNATAYANATIKYKANPTPHPTAKIDAEGKPAISPHISPPFWADANTIAHTPTFSANDAKNYVLQHGINENCVSKRCPTYYGPPNVETVEFMTIRDYVAKYGANQDNNLMDNPDRLICLVIETVKMGPIYLQGTTPPPVKDYPFYFIFDAHTGNQLSF